MRALRLVRDHADLAFALFCTVAMQIEVWFASYATHRPAALPARPLAPRSRSRSGARYPLAAFRHAGSRLRDRQPRAASSTTSRVMLVVVFVVRAVLVRRERARAPGVGCCRPDPVRDHARSSPTTATRSTGATSSSALDHRRPVGRRADDAPASRARTLADAPHGRARARPGRAGARGGRRGASADRPRAPRRRRPRDLGRRRPGARRPQGARPRSRGGPHRVRLDRAHRRAGARRDAAAPRDAARRRRGAVAGAAAVARARSRRSPRRCARPGCPSSSRSKASRTGSRPGSTSPATGSCRRR